MPETFVTIIGTVAACCTSFGLAPQAFRVWRTKETEQLSLGAFGLMLTGTILWLCYGIFRFDAVLIAANIIPLFFVSYVFIEKARALNKSTNEL
ncbi:hypothetical protein MASR2M18_13290 [Ignavibacteria bacterium]|jgi:MtN3 and saliva related transmembrane protein|nr:hypothetical protein [Bacteroidota bacterium]MCZ2132300.1 hypothetical protein [Bacteroidota bacterium]